MLTIADKIISDYSCIIYEAGILNIPLYFYNFDMKNYEIARGIAIKYNELPGYISTNSKEILESLEKEYDYKNLERFIKQYVNNKEKCTEKMVEEIEKNI